MTNTTAEGESDVFAGALPKEEIGALRFIKVGKQSNTDTKDHQNIYFMFLTLTRVFRRP